jgi:hypothetical protein
MVRGFFGDHFSSDGVEVIKLGAATWRFTNGPSDSFVTTCNVVVQHSENTASAGQPFS